MFLSVILVDGDIVTKLGHLIGHSTNNLFTCKVIHSVMC